MGLQLTEKSFKTGFFILASLLFLLLAFRNVMVPFNHDEAVTFFYYIQSGEFLPYHAHIDANNHVLNSGLGYYCFKLFGSSTFALRLPNLLSFLVLAVGVYRLIPHLKKNSSKLFLIAALLLSFHWLSFFNTARGYGISMAFLVMAFAFLLDYFKNPRIIFFYGFILSIQLAISANLTLIILTGITTLLLLIFQIIHKKIINVRLLPGYILHFFLLKYWIDFSFYLKENNALYYGEGNSYWEVSFKSLLELLSGISDSAFLISLAIFVLIITLISLLIEFKKWKENILKMESLFFFTTLFIGLIASFYILHSWKDVNYPEDRTALFFYPVFVLMMTFLLEKIRESKFLLAIPLLFFLHFAFSLNLTNHSMPEYETFPERFYTRLLEEQEKSKKKITIGGHRLTELMFAFMNYNHGGKLNPVDHGEEMNLYCDFGIAKKKDYPKYKNEYDIIDEADWDFVLLERKEKLHRNKTRIPLHEEFREGEQEYFEYLRISDTTLFTSNPLLVEVEVEVDHASQPFNGWMVLAIDDEEGKLNYYKRIPLNWLKYSWNQTGKQKMHFITGKLPAKIKSMVLFLWNHKKQFIRIKIHKINSYELNENIFVQ
jgi:hypothetical protein